MCFLSPSRTPSDANPRRFADLRFTPPPPSLPDSYFAANGGKGGNGPSDPPEPPNPLGGTPDHLASRGAGGGGSGMSGVGARFNPSHSKASAKTSVFFGGGESGPARFGTGVPGASMTGSSGAGAGGAAGDRFGPGMSRLSSLEEKEEEDATVSPMNGSGWPVEGTKGGGGAEGCRPVSFERLRKAGS